MGASVVDMDLRTKMHRWNWCHDFDELSYEDLENFYPD